MLVVYPKSKKDDLIDKETAILREFLNKARTKTPNLR